VIKLVEWTKTVAAVFVGGSLRGIAGIYLYFAVLCVVREQTEGGPALWPDFL
jgi:hypothetical protein